MIKLADVLSIALVKVLLSRLGMWWGQSIKCESSPDDLEVWESSPTNNIGYGLHWVSGVICIKGSRRVEVKEKWEVKTTSKCVTEYTVHTP
jgi:hypothetical protein